MGNGGNRRGVDGIRARIDAVDRSLISLISERMACADAMGAHKRELGLPVYDAERERALLEDRCGAVPPDLREDLRAVFISLMEASKRRQRAIVQRGMPRVAYQGTAGGYGHEAALRGFPHAPMTAYPLFPDVLGAVASGAADLGVLPVENSSTGTVLDGLELLAPMGCSIAGEIYLTVRHCLLGIPGAVAEGVREVFSHPQGLMQCASFLNAHPGWKRTPMTNTAVSARHVASMGDRTLSALASRRAAEEYGLAILAPDVQDRADNYTRFMTVAAAPARQGDKLTLRVILPHRPNALAAALRTLAEQGANLTSITSRPLPERAWAYQFYIDMLLPDPDGPEPMSEALRASGAQVDLLGRYPAGTPCDA